MHSCRCQKGRYLKRHVPLNSTHDKQFPPAFLQQDHLVSERQVHERRNVSRPFHGDEQQSRGGLADCVRRRAVERGSDLLLWRERYSWGLMSEAMYGFSTGFRHYQARQKVVVHEFACVFIPHRWFQKASRIWLSFLLNRYRKWQNRTDDSTYNKAKIVLNV